ncbi:hypothetical protein BJ912DRAFT_827015, partial [Pholiota molesta]
LDHLIFILIERTIPYFIHRHRRQEFGFEGGDLEVEERLKIEERAKTIPPEHIIATPNEDKIYFVKSQSKANIQYRVDLEAYDCDCQSFPTICFCKHIYAVQSHFGEACSLVPTSQLEISCSDSFDPDPTSRNATISKDEEPKLRIELAADINALIQKLSALAISLQPGKLCSYAEESLDVLHQHVKDIRRELGMETLSLPQTQNIAPNQNSWTETAAVMNVPVKSKRKKHTDPYAGGEQSGKRARKDARHSLSTIPSTVTPFSITQP